MIKRVIITLASLGIVTGIFFGVRYLIYLQSYKNIIKNINIEKVDLSKVSNGTYLGSFDALEVGAEVKVTVDNHKITAIKIIHHKNERGKKAEVIPERVIAAQSLQVDTVSGATNSSKVILKAIDNALEKGAKA
ncbi:MAG: FMN-binding protein [Clostridium sp.]|uniref:FMN-binding protein n=1 Tax=Clostridium sp. TaxID=1506 RepID=UPI0039EA90EE